MQILYSRCCGIDVHKDSVTVCVLVYSEGKEVEVRKKEFPWLAELLAHGLIKPSFVPPAETRELRDLARYRVKLVEECNRTHNRIHKVLEDACIKLDTVATDILGASDGAARDLKTAVNLQPDFWRAQYELGVALAGRGDTAGAAQHLGIAAQGSDPEVKAAALQLLKGPGRGK